MSNSQPKVWNKKTEFVPNNAVYIGRPSKWGNPFKVTRFYNNDMAVKDFKNYLLNNKKLLADVKKELKGKHLVCWCKPLSCHGDILLEIANEK